MQPHFSFPHFHLGLRNERVWKKGLRNLWFCFFPAGILPENICTCGESAWAYCTKFLPCCLQKVFVCLFVCLFVFFFGGGGGLKWHRERKIYKCFHMNKSWSLPKAHSSRKAWPVGFRICQFASHLSDTCLPAFLQYNNCHDNIAQKDIFNANLSTEFKVCICCRQCS